MAILDHPGIPLAIQAFHLLTHLYQNNKHVSSQEYFAHLYHKCQLVMQMSKYVSGLGGKVIAEMCFWIVNQSVHGINCPWYNVFTLPKLR